MAEEKRARLYLKARTDKDLKAQKSLLLEYADKAGYEVTEVAADYFPSQSSLKYVRLGVVKHDFEVLLISSWNRLGRDFSGTLDTMTELKNRNIAVQSVKGKNLSSDRVLSITRFAAAMQIPNEALPRELDETPFEDQEEPEGFDMTQSFRDKNHPVSLWMIEPAAWFGGKEHKRERKLHWYGKPAVRLVGRQYH